MVRMFPSTSVPCDKFVSFAVQPETSVRWRISLLALFVLCGCGVPSDQPRVTSLPVEPKLVAATNQTESQPAKDPSESEDKSGYVPLPTPLTPAERKFETVRRKIVPEFRCNELPLSSVVSQLRRHVDVDIDLDIPALADVAIDPDTPVTLNVRDRTVESVLNRILRQLELTWTIQDDAILVTTPEQAETQLITRVYDVGDLVDADGFDWLIDVVVGCLSPSSWDDVGGPGCIDGFNSKGIRALVVSQTIDVHDALAELLTALRQVRHPELVDSAALKTADPEMVARYQQRIARSLGPDPDRDELVSSMNRFAWDLYARLAEENDENLFFSPYGISTAFAMLYGGARQETAGEIARTMRWTATDEKLHAAFRSLDDMRWLGASSAGRFSVANRLWGQEGYPFKPKYTDTTLDYYQAKLARVDFADPSSAADRINNWTAVETRGLIREAIAAGEIDSSYRFVLTNVVYFRYPWQQEFSEEATIQAPFQGINQRFDVPMMTLSEDLCRYIDDSQGEGPQVLEKPYAGGNMALVVLLPPATEGALGELESRLNPASMAQWHDGLQPTEVEVHLPKFKIQREIDLKSVLARMGIERVFDPERSDLGKISDEEPLSVDLARHKAIVKVDERGTKAAAVTAIAGFGGALTRQQPPVFRADRPFVFYIIDKRTGCILFLGRLVDPRE